MKHPEILDKFDICVVIEIEIGGKQVLTCF